MYNHRNDATRNHPSLPASQQCTRVSLHHSLNRINPYFPQRILHKKSFRGSFTDGTTIKAAVFPTRASPSKKRKKETQNDIHKSTISSTNSCTNTNGFYLHSSMLYLLRFTLSHDTPHTTLPAPMTIFNQHPLSPNPTMSKPTTPVPKSPSPTNVASFPTEGWLSTTRPTKCVVPGGINDIIGYEDYYINNERVLCTRAFTIAAVATTINDGANPPGSTELDDKTGHNCKVSRRLYTSFGLMVLGLDHNCWTATCTKSAFRNLIIQDIDALMYYYDTYNYVNSMPVSSPSNLTDMACILARLTLLLVGAEACTPTSSIQCGEQTQKHDLLLEGQEETSLLFAKKNSPY
jgi:hypothetical protein